MSDKKVKKPLSAEMKKGIKIAVIAVLIVAILCGLLAFFNANASKGYSKLIISCMPKSISGMDNGTKIDFYREYNKEYNPKTDEPITAYKIYYYDKNGKRVDLVNGQYKSETQEMQVLLGFFYEAQENIQILKNVTYVLIALFVLAMFALFIFLWYKSWVRRQNKKRKSYLTDFADDDKE